MRLPTASAIDRAMHCPASCVLPQVHSTSEDAERGTAVHAFIVDARARGRDAALDAIEIGAPHRRLCEAMPLDRMPTGGRHELALAWSAATDTARLLGENIGRNYPALDPAEFAGTADLAGLIEPDLGGVWDWKSGYRRLGPARESWQLRFNALALSRYLSCSRVRAAFWYLRDDGLLAEDAHEFNAIELADFADDLAQLIQRIAHVDEQVRAEQVPTVSEGPWCDYCGAVSACPAKTALARALVVESANLEQRITSLTIEDAGRAWAKLRAFEAIAKRIKAGLQQFARVHPVPLPSGKVLREVEWPNTEVDGEIAWRELHSLFGPDIAHVACPRQTSQAAIERAIRPLAAAQSVAVTPLYERAIKAIADAGGVIKTTEPQIREVKAA